MLDEEEAEGNIFKVAKQMVKNNRDVVAWWVVFVLRIQMAGLWLMMIS